MTLDRENIPQFTHSVKLETTAKGFVQVNVHVHSNSETETRTSVVRLYSDTITDLRARGMKVAE
jgi:hypothetical protein